MTKDDRDPGPPERQARGDSERTSDGAKDRNAARRRGPGEGRVARAVPGDRGKAPQSRVGRESSADDVNNGVGNARARRPGRPVLGSGSPRVERKDSSDKRGTEGERRSSQARRETPRGAGERSRSGGAGSDGQAGAQAGWASPRSGSNSERPARTSRDKGRRPGGSEFRGNPSAGRGKAGAGKRPSPPSNADSRADRPRRVYDNDPIIPEDVSADQLDRVTRHSLQTLPEGLADLVAAHLVAAERVIDTDPRLALAHTLAAARRAGRVAVVREAVGVAAYSAGDYARAISELRAAARISGSVMYLPMIADCERGLGRPERALELVASADAGRLDRAGKVEMLIVAAGARRDLGQLSAAVLTLQVPALKARTDEDWLPRLRYAYADALLADSRPEEALRWFRAASQADPAAVTEAQERVDELQGIVFVVDRDESEGQETSGTDMAHAMPSFESEEPQTEEHRN